MEGLSHRRDPQAGPDRERERGQFRADPVSQGQEERPEGRRLSERPGPDSARRGQLRLAGCAAPHRGNRGRQSARGRRFTGIHGPRLMFKHVALIGLGLIGSSLAHAVKRHNLAERITGYDMSESVRKRAAELELAAIAATPADAVKGADLVILCSPVGSYKDVAAAM